MAKRKTTNARAVEIGLDEQDKRALWRTVLLSGIVLGGIQLVLYLVLGKLFAQHPGWLNPARTGLGLLAFWMVITATVRTFERVREGVAAMWLILIGVASAALGIFFFLVALRIWNNLGDHGAALPGYNIIGFYAGGGLVASLISLINLRVNHERYGNVLEILVIGAAVAVFFWLSR